MGRRQGDTSLTKAKKKLTEVVVFKGLAMLAMLEIQKQQRAAVRTS
jgi:hypothetical protein